jgi:phospholipid/cholesterol/gamma-HCH transport system ATP-binding protein
MGIGENIVFIADGLKEWQGSKETVISSNNKKLNELVFASDLFKKVKEIETHENKT